LELPDVAENLPRAASEKQQRVMSENAHNFPNIVVCEICFW